MLVSRENQNRQNSIFPGRLIFCEQSLILETLFRTKFLPHLSHYYLIVGTNANACYMWYADVRAPTERLQHTTSSPFLSSPGALIISLEPLVNN